VRWARESASSRARTRILEISLGVGGEASVTGDGKQVVRAAGKANSGRDSKWEGVAAAYIRGYTGTGECGALLDAVALPLAVVRRSRSERQEERRTRQQGCDKQSRRASPAQCAVRTHDVFQAFSRGLCRERVRVPEARTSRNCDVVVRFRS